MSESHIGFIAYTDARLIPELTERLRDGLARAGFSSSGAEHYSGRCGWRLHVVAAPTPTGCELGSHENWGCWAILGLARVHLATLEMEPLLEAIADGCESTEVILGRSFHPVGSDLIRSGELVGLPDYVGWVQYYGPELSSRLDPARIRSAGFFRVVPLPNGAHLAMTRERYDAEWPFEQRRPLLDKLGLTPRVLTARSPQDGGPTALVWC